MKIRATRSFLNDIGMVRRGAEVDIADVKARYLISRGRAVEVTDATAEAPTSGEGRKADAQAEAPAKPKHKTPSKRAAAHKPGE
jgi:hypothetical protein